LAGIDQQRTNPATDQKLVTLLNSPDSALTQYNYIVDTANYAFVGDGTGSNIALNSQIYDPTIVSDIPNIDYLTLKNNNIRGSDHMPVISYTSAATASSSERTRVQRPHDAYSRYRQDEGATRDDRYRERDEDSEVIQVDGGYRKKRRSQRKLKQRKSKRHTKKRNYRKNKK
jgi:hypothetical protein